MATAPLITFKAGRCRMDTSSKPYKVTPDSTPGYIYLYPEDECMHFCWRPRNKPVTEPELDLLMFPTDGHFEPYEYVSSNQPTSKTNGRILVLKFGSSSSRHLFWLQSKPISARNPAVLSHRDTIIAHIVDLLLQGDDVNVSQMMSNIQEGPNSDADGDETMEDVEGQGSGNGGRSGGGGGAGPGATGGDIREEGAGPREGGADGGRAAGSGPTDAASVVQNFLNSLSGGGAIQDSAHGQSAMYTTLADLLPASTTITVADSLPVNRLDELLRLLPPTTLLLAQESAAQIDGMVEPTPGTANAALEAMSLNQKRALLKKVLRSPQFHQSLGSLTVALRDGGLPTIAEALGVKVENNGYVKGGSVPLGGGDAVEAFVEGMKRVVQRKK